jgi:hypothetical protein
VEVGDTFTCLVDGTSSGNQATVGANWLVMQTNIDGAVIGPASSTANNLPTFSGTTGKGLQDSGVAVALVSGAAQKANNLSDVASVPAARDHLSAASSVLGGDEWGNDLGSTSGSITLDLSTASVFSVNPSGNITAVSITNVPASGRVATVTLIVHQGATPRTIATPSGGIFLSQATPTQVANKICVFTYLTTDGGTTWICSAAVQV